MVNNYYAVCFKQKDTKTRYLLLSERKDGKFHTELDIFDYDFFISSIEERREFKNRIVFDIEDNIMIKIKEHYDVLGNCIYKIDKDTIEGKL